MFTDPLTGLWESQRWDLFRCPASQVGDEWGYAVSVWSAYGGQDDRGPLPIAGGWLDQTLWFAEADAILRSERLRYLAKREEERQKQHEQRSKRGR